VKGKEGWELTVKINTTLDDVKGELRECRDICEQSIQLLRRTGEVSFLVRSGGSREVG
jgi:hypothetical protein